MLGRKKGFIFVIIVALLAVAFFVRPGEAQRPAGKKAGAKTPQSGRADRTISRPMSGRVVGFAETRPARELAATSVATIDAELKREGHEINELNEEVERIPNAKARPQKDGALVASWTPNRGFELNIPAPSLTFEGIPVQGSAPPDTTGAVGPNDYVQIVNSTLVRVWDKNGNPRGPAFPLSALFAPLGGVAANSDNGDGLALYDRMANRWVLSQFAFASSASPPYHQPIAVSKTSDPLGEYWVYDFITPGPEFPDYGKIGAWPDGYYFTTRQFTNGASYNGFGALAFDRKKMLVGDPSASYIYFNVGPNQSDASSGLLPSDFFGITPPPAGAPNLFSVFTDDAYQPDSFDTQDALRLYDFHADFAVPGNSSFIERPESPLQVAAFDSRSPSGRADIEQPAPSVAADRLDSIPDRLMLRLQYVNRAGTQLTTTVHTVNAGSIPPAGRNPTAAEYKAGTRYYVLRKTSPTAAWTVLDQATISSGFDAEERWMGSSALDNAGNLAVGYSISSLSTFPSLAYTGRLATDPPNTVQPEVIMWAGTGVQRGTSNRWGDYSNLSLDPVDDSTFWYTNEYYTTTNQTFNWQTRIGRFKFAGSSAPPQGTLSGTVTTCDNGEPIQDALVEVTGGPSNGYSAATKADGTYSFNVSPGDYTVTIINPAHDCTMVGPFNVTITDAGTTTQDACLSGSPKFVLDSPAGVVLSGGDGNGQIDASECNNLNVTLLNDGCLLGQNVTATLSSSTPGVTVTQPNSAYPNTAEGATSTNTTPFQVSTSSSFSCGTQIDFTLTVNFPGGSSVVTFSLDTCAIPPATVNGTLDASDPSQEGRLGRNGSASSCGSAKACPGIFGAGNRRYDVLTFPNGPSAACATITTTPTNATAGGAILAVAYLNSYTPPGIGTTDNVCLNYLGDPGGSPNFGFSNSFSVDVPASATLVVVVEETGANPPGSTYSIQVSGLIGDTRGPGACPGAPLQINSVVSRKPHGAAGDFSIPMPQNGPTGVEDRTSTGGYDIVLTFNNPVTSGSANVTSGTATVDSVMFSGNDMIVHLSGTTDAELVTLQVNNVNFTLASASVKLGFLVADSTNDRVVNGADTGQVRSRAGQTITTSNFRSDVNADGLINGADTGIARSKAGNSIP